MPSPPDHPMKTIGIVGGLAWPSTIVYYRTINELVAQRLGATGIHCAKLVLAQTDFAEIEYHQRQQRWDLVRRASNVPADTVTTPF